ncbi:MAG: Methanogenesis regulatory histidine kinase FilI [Candidatus Methanogaster sp.]|nr:MAG: Methanogenesis regulatory histidine kinase FilI [ANME-2 cluster archaeon]
MKIRMKIFLTIFALVLVTGMATTIANQIFLEDTVEKDICNHLLTAAESRDKHIETFLDGEKEAIKQLSESIVIERLLLTGKDDPDYGRRYDDVIRRLTNTAAANKHTYGVFVIDKNGTIIASSEEIDIGKNKSDNPYFAHGKEDVYIKDAYTSPTRKIDSISFSAPVLDSYGAVFLGVVVIRTSIEELNKITIDRTGLGDTGEIFLVNKDGYMVTPSRFLNGTFLTQKVETFHSGIEPGKYMAGYEHEVILCKSYTGAEVLRVHTHIPEMGWCLMAEMSTEEAFAPVVTIGDIMLLILVGLLLLGISAAILISGMITEPIERLHKGTEELISGNLDYRVGTSKDDEIGQLSRAFDEMTANLKESRAELEDYSRGLEGMAEERTAELDRKVSESEQQRLAILNIAVDLEETNESLESEVSKRKRIEENLRKKQSAEEAYTDILMVASRTIDLNTIVTEGLANLMKYTDSPMGVVYLYKRDSKMLLPAVARGAEGAVAEQSFLCGEGIPGETAAKKEMIVLTDLKDTIYKIPSGYGVVLPDTIISTPILFKNALLGVVLTCHTNGATPELVGFIKRVTDQIAVAINNANAYTEIQEMAAELRSERDKLEMTSLELATASRIKSEFLANMSHELRTPLNSIIGFSEILQDGVFGPVNAKQAKYVNNVLVSGKHLLQLINDILDLSKVEAGKIELVYEDFPVSDAIKEVITLTASIAAKKSILIDLSVDEGLPMIHADEGKFKQILYNLLSNAIKFTPKYGLVKVGARQGGGVAEISVTDTGIGISEENQKKLFQPFIQADASTSREYGGTGLGLSLVKMFSELHGGTAWAKSELGKGSTFTFTIPVAGGVEAETEATDADMAGVEIEPEVEVAAEAEVREKMRKVSAVAGNVTAEEIAATRLPEIIDPEGASGNEPLILVVEDDKNSSELLTVTLTGIGYRVIPACNGREALAVAKRLKPFAITLDIMMPGMDGWDVLKYLKYDSETSNIPVIVISMLDDAEVGFSLGVVDYFVKPIEKDVLIAALNNLKKLLGIERPKALVVDDEHASVELIASMIEPAGFEVIRAYGGEEGIEKSFSEHPDVLILDLMMPGVSGFDVVSRLKMAHETRNIPIIICTSRDPTSEDIIRLRSDVISVMRKGEFAREELISEIKRVATLVRG